MTVMLSRPEKCWSMSELIEKTYDNPDDEPDLVERSIITTIHHLRRKFRKTGIDLSIEPTCGGWRLSGCGLLSARTRVKSPQIAA